ncbi:hypothetical protein D3C73_1040680 [compost metagenome]
MFINLSSQTFLKSAVFVDLDKSASNTTMFLLTCPISAKAFPYASLVAIFLPISFLLLFLLTLVRIALY